MSAGLRAAGEPKFELRGLVQNAAELTSENGRPFVQIAGVQNSLQLSGIADGQGRFRFKKIPAGMYLLTVFIPRVARTRRTIEIGPSFADRQNRVEVALKLASRPRRPDRFQVSAGQLSIPQRARDEYDKGLQRLEKKDRRGAAAAFGKALETAPDFSAAHYQLGLLATQELRYADAAECFRKALVPQPSNYQYLLSLGKSLLIQRDGPQAVPVNERAVRLRPDDSEAQVQLGFSYLLAGRPEEAEKHLKETVALDPAHYLFPQLALAEIYYQRQDHGAVIEQLEQFLKLHPDSPTATDVVRTLVEVRRRLVQPVD